MLKPKTKRARSSITGRFVSFLYALSHKATTIFEAISPQRKRRSKKTVRTGI